MRKILIIMIMVFLSVPAWAEDSYKVYDSGQNVVSKYTVKSRSDGSYAVYQTGKPVVPKYIVKPNPTGSGYNVYSTQNPLIPAYRVNNPTQVPKK